MYSGTGLLADLKCQEFSGKHKIFTRIAPEDFELLIKLVGPKIVKTPDCEQLLQFKVYIFFSPIMNRGLMIMLKMEFDKGMH